MDLGNQSKIGLQAGLLAGYVVVGLFFVADLVKLAPLATPKALSNNLFGPGGLPFDTPAMLESVTIMSFAGHLAAVTLMHLLVFSALGVGAVVLCRVCGIPMNALTAALYGLVVCSLVFYVTLWLTDAPAVVELPSFRSVLLVNLLAGTAMGGYFQAASKKALRTA
ncbi:MAG: hypothetical protein E4H37_05185 [Gemmatimonadales bacterium]|nr:MAG: hypothetical protein E4H37_05185 [Gemmatimonadales bacterium]